jgi:5-carboxymethyl-2-hydroxymuconate isomerase
MPHFTIEYSANLDSRLDMAAVVEVVRKAAIEAGIFPLGGIRVRAIRCEHYAIAAGNPAQSRSGLCGKQIRALLRHADQRQGDELEAQQSS